MGESYDYSLAPVEKTCAKNCRIVIENFRGNEIDPGAHVQTDSEIDAYNRRTVGSEYHASGSCKMGVDDEAVVDPWLRVHGIEGLRVIDASIMPTIVSGNTNGPAMAIGLRASELILETRTVQPEMFAES